MNFPRVIACTIAQLKYLGSVDYTADVTYSLWPAILCNQLVQNIGIITACVPYIKVFFQSLESGMIRTDDLRRRGLITAYGYGSSSKSGGDNLAGASSFPSHFGLEQQPSRAADGGAGSSTINTIASTNGHSDATPAEGNFATVTADSHGSVQHESDAESQKSSSMIIKQTKSWQVKRQAI